MGMNQSERVISQALKTASRAALEVHLALTIDGLEDVTLETEVNNILTSCRLLELVGSSRCNTSNRR